MPRDAMTNDEIKQTAALLAEVGDLDKVARSMPHIDLVFFKVNAEALYKAAGIPAPEPKAKK